jgi:MoaA/NifB/PqqE/SkfB family radical SAM enzyme
MFKTIIKTLASNKTFTQVYYKVRQVKVNLNFQKPVSLSKSIIKDYNKSRKPLFIKNVCNAPFVSMFIGIGGNIGVCCYNRELVLGSIYETRLSEAWFGDKLKSFRNKIKKCDFSSGCYLCKMQIEQSVHQTLLARNYDEFNNTSKKYPQIIEFELSNKCNLECIMCSEVYSSKIEQNIKKGKISDNKLDEDAFLKQLKQFIPHFKKAKFSGGEPFLISIYYKIWELLIELNPKCKIVIQTNGTILNEKIKKLLKEGNFNLSISVDSLQKDNFELIRRNGCFEEYYNNLFWFIDFCKQKDRFIGVSTCFMRQNWKEIPKIVTFCNLKQIPITFNKVLHPPKCAIWGSPSQYIVEIENYLSKIILPKNNKIEYDNAVAYSENLFQLEQWKNEALLKEAVEHKYISLDVKDLETLFVEKIASCLKLNYNDSVYISNVISFIQENLSIYRNELNYKVLLIELLNIPEEIIIRELSNNTESLIHQQIASFLNKIKD